MPLGRPKRYLWADFVIFPPRSAATWMVIQAGSSVPWLWYPGSKRDALNLAEPYRAAAHLPEARALRSVRRDLCGAPFLPQPTPRNAHLASLPIPEFFRQGDHPPPAQLLLQLKEV